MTFEILIITGIALFIMIVYMSIMYIRLFKKRYKFIKEQREFHLQHQLSIADDFEEVEG